MARSPDRVLGLLLFLCAAGFMLAAVVVAYFNWPSVGDADYGTPHGTVYQVPNAPPLTPGGWTVVTVRDVFADRYSFTAFVPKGDEQAESRKFQVIDRDNSASALVRRQVETNNFSSNATRGANGDITFVIHRPPQTAASGLTATAPALDRSVVPGTIMFVNFSCQLPDVTAQIASEPGNALPASTVLPLDDLNLTAQQDRCRAAPAKDGGQPAPGVTRYYVQELGIVSAQPTLIQRLLVIGLVASSFLFLIWALTVNKQHRGIGYLMIGKDNRYSNAQFQTVVWFFVLLVALTSTQLFRIGQGGLALIAWISIPPSLLALSGLSALTFVGAAIITNNNVKNDVVKPKALAPHFPDDLYHNDAGEFDLGDFQSALISVIAAVAYLVILLSYLGSLSLKRDILPDVDGTILSIFGIAQGAYLVKKALKVSEQEGVALAVTPETVQCPPGQPGTTTLIVAWNQNHANGSVLRLSGLRNQLDHPGVTFEPSPPAVPPAPVTPLNLTLDPTLRREVSVTLPNPGAGQTHEVVIRGVVNGLNKTAKVTVRGA